MDSMSATPTRQVVTSPGIELVLVCRGRELRLPGDSGSSLSIGLHRENNLVMTGTYLSRRHATLHWRRNRFELVDHSTNGSFVQLEDGQISHVHRTSVHLWGTGFLSFGEPLTVSSAIRFSHA